MIKLLMALYLATSVKAVSLDASCNECIETYCITECGGLGDDCGSCIQRWCSYEC